MNYGLTIDGIKIKRLQDILTETANELISTFGPVDTNAASVFGQLNGVFSKPAADVWEQLSNIYYALNPDTAEGIALDYVCAFNGIIRLPALPSNVDIGFLGDIGTVIPADTLLIATSTGKEFSVISDNEISNIAQKKCYVKIDFHENTEYEFILTYDTIIEDYIWNSTTTPIETFVDVMVTSINNGNVCDAVNLTGGVIKLTSKLDNFDIEIVSNSYFYFIVKCKSVDLGAISTAAQSIDDLVNPISGVDEVINYEEGIIGSNTETDAELRLRRSESLNKPGGGTLAAIVAQMKEITDVITVKGYENVTDTIDADDRPPHCIDIVIAGGSDEDIANKLWEVKGGGIQTWSSNDPQEYYDIYDSNGDLQRVYFTRPIIKYGWLKITISLYDEETFPTGGEDSIKDNCLLYGNEFTMGLDIIPVRFIPSVLLIPGIETVSIEVSKTDIPGGSPSYSSSVISVDDNELIDWNVDRMSVTIV